MATLFFLIVISGPVVYLFYGGLTYNSHRWLNRSLQVRATPCINSPTTQLRKLQDSLHTCRLWSISTSMSFTAYLRDFLLKSSVLLRRPPRCLTSEKSEGSLQPRLPSVVLNYSFSMLERSGIGRGLVKMMYKTGGQKGMDGNHYSILSPPWNGLQVCLSIRFAKPRS